MFNKIKSIVMTELMWFKMESTGTIKPTVRVVRNVFGHVRECKETHCNQGFKRLHPKADLILVANEPFKILDCRYQITMFVLIDGAMCGAMRRQY